MSAQDGDLKQFTKHHIKTDIKVLYNVDTGNKKFTLLQ